MSDELLMQSDELSNSGLNTQNSALKKVPAIRFKGFSGEWEEKELGEITSKIGSGKTPKGGDSTYVLEGVPLIRSQNIYDNIVDLRNAAYITPQTHEGMKNSSVFQHDVLLNITGASIGRSAAYTFSNQANVNQHVCIIRLHKGYNSVFTQLHLASSKGRQLIDDNQAGGAREGLNFQQISKMQFSFASTKEQAAIGDYFQKLDSLISQHQQKHDKISRIKKAMLEKMFPKPGQTTPEIRFKGFSGEWEELLFEKCFNYILNNTFSRSDLNYEKGKAKNIHYGDILTKFSDILDINNEMLPFVTNDKLVDKLKHAALKNGDIVIADAAEDSTVGKCTELLNIGEQLIFSGLHTISVRPVQPFAPKYLGFYLNSSSYHKQLLPLMQGTKVLSISKTSLKSTYLMIPKCLEEQAAIGNYFQKLDSLINQHQQQITKLNHIKQACLSKMFV